MNTGEYKTDKYKEKELQVTLGFVCLLNGFLTYSICRYSGLFTLSQSILRGIALVVLYYLAGYWITKSSEKVRIWAYCGNAVGWTDTEALIFRICWPAGIVTIVIYLVMGIAGRRIL